MRRITFDLAEIQAFVAVAEKLNFRAAAESLFISQPALSRRIDKLEQSVGARLIERTTRRVSLTEAGMHLREHARAAIGELELGMRGISECANRRGGLVTMACVPSLVTHTLPRILKSFAERNPLVRLRIIDEAPQAVLASVVSGEAEFGVNFIGNQEPDIEFQAIYTEAYVLALRSDHALARRKSVDWEELVDEKFVAVSAGSASRILIDHALAKLPRRPRVSYEANHVNGALGMVEAGLGIAAIPGLALSKNAHPSVVGVPLTKPAISREVGLITRKGMQLAPPAMALYELLKLRGHAK